MTHATYRVLFGVAWGLLGVAAGIVTFILWWPDAHGWQHALLILFVVTQTAASGYSIIGALTWPMV